MNKEAYKQKAEAKIEEGQAQLNTARAKAKNASADVKIETEKHISEIDKKIDLAKKKLLEMGDVAEDSMDDLKVSFDNAWNDISGGIKKVVSNFK